MSLRAANRYQAFGMHFLVSLFIVVNFTFLILSRWYPEPFFSADGGWSIFRMIILVDLVLGPCLTLIIYKPGKKGLKFDMGAIAFVQIAALIYGGSVLYQERPMFLVFSVDRFVLVSSDDVNSDRLKFPALLESESAGPVKVFARMPSDPKERNKFVTEVFSGQPDLEFRAEYYEPYLENLTAILSKSKDIQFLKTVSDSYRQKIESFENNHCHQECAYFPLVGKKQEVLLAISQKDGSVLGSIDVNPWVRKKSIKSAALNKS
ncbi:TfpX/TfpZ family type IV pilin accessory protein [Kaarinaea lacus]